MNLTFYKYHGTGNDFILIDNRSLTIKLSQQQIAFLCDRHLGIGADGLMMLYTKEQYDFGMVYYNSDGKEGSMCGNGGRSIVAFAKELGLVKEKATFIAVDGDHVAAIFSSEQNTLVKLKMNDVDVINRYQEDFILNTGSPHYVTFVDAVESLDVFSLGKKIRLDKKVSTDGVNVNFVEVRDNHIFVRTFERGVEDETLSCGTGSIASAIAYSEKYNALSGVVKIKTLGGDLQVHLVKSENIYKNIWLEGPATFVFKGTISI